MQGDLISLEDHFNLLERCPRRFRDCSEVASTTELEFTRPVDDGSGSLTLHCSVRPDCTRQFTRTKEDHTPDGLPILEASGLCPTQDNHKN